MRGSIIMADEMHYASRGRFHNAAAEDVKRIKDENAALQRQLKELEELINAK